MYTVIGQLRSRAFRVLWTLEELGQDYAHVDAAPRSEAARTHHPPGKIPIMLVDGEVLTDSVAIMSYLADVHGQLGSPAGTIPRARLDAMLHNLNEELDATLWLMARHSFILPQERRVPAAIETAKWEAAQALDRLADRITASWLMGETFTIADILAVHCASWAQSLDIRSDNDGLRAYIKRARARPAFRKTAALAHDDGATPRG